MDVVAAYYLSLSVGVHLGDGNGSFPITMAYSIGDDSSPWWVALGDVNNDHQLDIVSANQGTHTIVALGDLNHDNYLDLVVTSEDGYIRVFLGYGNGSFTIWNLFPTDQKSFCFSITLSDLNSDTHLDIVVANSDANSIGVSLGYGDGMFEAQTFYSTGSGSSPYYVIVADFNNDNISDIAASNHGSDTVIMFYELGNGSFKYDRTYSTGLGSKPYAIAAVGFNNNTQLDIAVVLTGNKHIAILSEYKAAAFVNQTKYSTGSAPQPYSLVIGDFNHDNRPDIVVANSGTDNLGILLALGNGTFNMTMKYQLGTDFYPQYVITCDINKDDQSDIINVHSKVDSISAIIGYGNGSFAEQLIYPTGNGSHPIAVAAGDFNIDTRLDLIIANQGTDNLGIFFAFKYNVFQNQKTYSSDDSLEPAGIAVNDFNNDTYLDIAATFFSSNKIGILLGNGNGSFTTIMTYPTGNDSKPYGIVVDDLNNDSRSDIVVANHGTNTIGIFLGYNDGSFTPIITYSAGKSSGPVGITVGDVNNDNQIDIVVANFQSNSVGVLIGEGNGNFSNVTIYPTGTGSTCYSVVLSDFDNDGNLDIAVANLGTHNIEILFGYGDGTFRKQIILTMALSSQPISLAVGDFNSDSQLDIAVADCNNHKIGIFIGDGNRNFAAMRTYSAGNGSQPTYISIGDFNNDNISDVAVANGGTNSIVVLFGLGDGSFLLGKSYSTGARSSPNALAIGDFNNDIQLDIVVANSVANNLGVFLANGYQPFGSILKFFSYKGSKPNSVAVSDFNNDGYAYIVVANYGTDNLGILLGYGDGTFQPIIKYSTGNGSAPLSVAIADFNNDNHSDIVVTNSQTDNIAIFLGTGNGEFVTGMNYSTGVRSYPFIVTTGDFNNDNITDIAVANYDTSSYDYNPDSIAVTDLNHDNWLDIVIACHGTDHIETFIKMCP